MTDTLREALEQIAKPKYGLQGIIEDYSDANAFNYHAMTYWRNLAQSYESTARAALAAAPQPAPTDREAMVGWLDREFSAWNETSFDTPLTDYLADALLARGLRLPGDGSRNRVEYDDAGKLDEVVADAGMHLERMSDQGWFLSGQRSDGSEIAIWLKGKVVAVEERPAIRVVEGGDDAA